MPAWLDWTVRSRVRTSDAGATLHQHRYRRLGVTDPLLAFDEECEELFVDCGTTSRDRPDTDLRLPYPGVATPRR